jgi:hypothetical protein
MRHNFGTMCCPRYICVNVCKWVGALKLLDKPVLKAKMLSKFKVDPTGKQAKIEA